MQQAAVGVHTKRANKYKVNIRTHTADIFTAFPHSHQALQCNGSMHSLPLVALLLLAESIEFQQCGAHWHSLNM